MSVPAKSAADAGLSRMGGRGGFADPREDADGGKGQGRTDGKRGQGAGPLIDAAKQQTRRQGAYADREVVPPIGQPLPLRAGKFADKSLLRRFSQAGEQGISDKEKPYLPCRVGESKRQVDHGVPDPTKDHESA